MQKLSDSKTEAVRDSKIKATGAGDQKVSGSLASKKGLTLFGFLASSGAVTREKKTTTVLEASPEIPRSSLPSADLTAVMNWVALEEKIVHDHKGQKKESFLKTLRPNLPSADPTAVMTWVALEERIVHDYKEQKKEPFLKIPRPHPSRVDPTAVMSWVALEEKIVHDYKEQKAFQVKSLVLWPKNPAKQSVRRGEAYTTPTEVPLISIAAKLQDLFRGSQKVLPNAVAFFLVFGWIVVWALVFLHIQGAFSSHGTVQKLSRLQNENKQLGRSYDEFKSISKNQSAEIEWLNKQIRDLSLELKTVKEDKVVLENKYRGELMQMTAGYELEIDRLKGTLQTQEAIVKALKAQGQAFDKIVDQAGLSGLSGVAGFSQGSLASATTVAQGVVTSVNRRQGSVVINLGSDQGVGSKQWVTISRNGRGLASGRIDRVYPTMSVALIRDANVLPMIQVGDSVSFV